MLKLTIEKVNTSDIISITESRYLDDTKYKAIIYTSNFSRYKIVKDILLKYNYSCVKTLKLY